MVNQNGDHLSSPARAKDSKMWKLLSPSRNGQIPSFGMKTPENDLTRVGGLRRALKKKEMNDLQLFWSGPDHICSG